MKPTLFLLLVVVVAVASALPALNNPFLKAAQKRQVVECTTFPDLAVGSRCNVTSDCQAGLTCVNSTCAFQTKGSLCLDDNECAGSTFDVCLSGECDSYRMAGDACTSSAQCYYGTCDSGKCTAYAENQTCSAGYCAVGHFCSEITGQCTKAIPVGGKCGLEILQLSSDFFEVLRVCADGICSGFGENDTCVAIGSVDVGGHCLLGFDCKSTLACDTTTFSCVAPPANPACDDSTGCPLLTQSCKCNAANASVEGACTASPCGPQALAQIACYIEKGCSIFTTSLVPGTCAAQCLSVSQSAYCCASPNHVDTGFTCSSGSSTGSNTGAPTTTGKDSGAASVVLSMMVIVACLLALLL